MTDEELEAFADILEAAIRLHLSGDPPWDLATAREATDLAIRGLLAAEVRFRATTTEEDIATGRITFELSVASGFLLAVDTVLPGVLEGIEIDSRWPLDGDPWECDTMGDVTECHWCNGTKPGHRKGCAWVMHDPCPTCDGTGLHTELGGLIGGPCQDCGASGRR